MRSIAGPSRTRRPRNAKGSMRKGWIRSSGAVWLGEFNVGRSGDNAGKRISSLALCPWTAGSRGSPHSERLAETPGKNTLLGMEPVLRLVPDDRLRTVDDPGGNLLT